ncbi:Uncharacterised protein [Vibrio cholerae]|nr:Uncharacterised protein [Vibrio cholerae]
MRIRGKPNRKISFTLISPIGRLAIASKRMFFCFPNNRIAKAKEKVAPLPPINTNVPIKDKFIG